MARTITLANFDMSDDDLTICAKKASGCSTCYFNLIYQENGDDQGMYIFTR